MKRTITGAFGFACLAALAFACSTAAPLTPGQVMLAVQTDLSLPKDVDKVRIEVASNGKVHFQRDYEVGPEGLRIPATLGIIAGKDPSVPVTVRVIARKSGELRVLREAITTIPTDRVATLRVPITWLCDEMVVDDGNGGAKSACAEGETCVSGSCVTATVAVEKLRPTRRRTCSAAARAPARTPAAPASTCSRASRPGPRPTSISRTASSTPRKGRPRSA